MNRKILAALLALPLASAAHAQETVIQGSQRPDLIDGAVGGKLVINATGIESDVMVIRLGDGSIYAAGTLAQFKAGVVRGSGNGHFSAVDPNAHQGATSAPTKRAMAPKAPLLKPIDALNQKLGLKAAASGNRPVDDSVNATDPDTGGTDVWNENPGLVELHITIPAASAAFGRGSVTVTRGDAIRDTDRISLR